MKTLVMGGNGFIGSHLVDKLLSEGHEVRVFDKYQELYRKPLEMVDYHMGDFGNRGLVLEALKGIDTVFHLISTTVPKTSNDDPAFDLKSNVVDTLYLIDSCLKCNIKKIVYVSSGGTIYGNAKQIPIDEESPTEPECSYGISKLTIEKYLALYNHLYGLDYVIVRPSNPYGERQNPSGILGAISVFLGNIARDEPINIWGDGEVVRDYIYVADLVEGIYKAAFTASFYKIFNLGNGEGTSLNQLVQLIKNITNKSFSVKYTEKRIFDIPIIFLNIQRANRELNWVPKILLEDGIEKTWKSTMDLYS